MWLDVEEAKDGGMLGDVILPLFNFWISGNSSLAFNVKAFWSSGEMVVAVTKLNQAFELCSIIAGLFELFGVFEGAQLCFFSSLDLPSRILWRSFSIPLLSLYHLFWSSLYR